MLSTNLPPGILIKVSDQSATQSSLSPPHSVDLDRLLLQVEFEASKSDQGGGGAPTCDRQHDAADPIQCRSSSVAEDSGGEPAAYGNISSNEETPASTALVADVDQSLDTFFDGLVDLGSPRSTKTSSLEPESKPAGSLPKSPTEPNERAHVQPASVDHVEVPRLRKLTVAHTDSQPLDDFTSSLESYRVDQDPDFSSKLFAHAQQAAKAVFVERLNGNCPPDLSPSRYLCLPSKILRSEELLWKQEGLRLLDNDGIENCLDLDNEFIERLTASPARVAGNKHKLRDEDEVTGVVHTFRSPVTAPGPTALERSSPCVSVDTSDHSAPQLRIKQEHDVSCEWMTETPASAATSKDPDGPSLRLQKSSPSPKEEIRADTGSFGEQVGVPQSRAPEVPPSASKSSQNGMPAGCWLEQNFPHLKRQRHVLDRLRRPAVPQNVGTGSHSARPNPIKGSPSRVLGDSDGSENLRAVSTVLLPVEGPWTGDPPKFSASGALSSFLDLRAGRFKKPILPALQASESTIVSRCHDDASALVEDSEIPFASRQNSHRTLMCNQDSLMYDPIIVSQMSEQLPDEHVEIPATQAEPSEQASQEVPPYKSLTEQRVIVLDENLVRNKSLMSVLDHQDEGMLRCIYRRLDSTPDLMLSPRTCLLCTNLQVLKQKSLPGVKSPTTQTVQDRLRTLSPQFEQIFILVAVPSTSASSPPSPDLVKTMTDFTTFCISLQLQALTPIKVTPIWVTIPPSPTTRRKYASNGVPHLDPLTAWTWHLIHQHSHPVLPDMSFIDATTIWELFLREASINALAAQVMLGMLKRDSPIITSEAAEDGLKSDDVTDTEQGWGLRRLVSMSAQTRRKVFGEVVGDKCLQQLESALRAAE